MQPNWTLNPTVLVRWPFVQELWPLQDMSPAEKENASARFVIIVTIAMRYLYPTQNYWIFGILALAYLWFSTAFEMFEDKVLQQTEKALQSTDKTRKEAPAREKVIEETNTEYAKTEEMAERGAKVKYDYLKNLLNDDKQRALNFTRSAREMNPRGEVVWSEQQRIYANRNYIRPSTDEYDDLFYGDVGTFKFLSRRT